ncbi:hypothetical protein [Roseobacter sp.]|uniref:hypothetical protein n=1 Tax=Roseobacter sp. TaxID=1907202 RepID=UPI00385AFC1F
MAMVFALIGGVAGFFAALMTLFLGHGLWQAFINYWQVGTLVLISLMACHLISVIFRTPGTGLEARSIIRAKNQA